MCEPILGSHDPFFFNPITFLSLAQRKVNSHHSLKFNNNWLQELYRVNKGDEVTTSSPSVNRPQERFQKLYKVLSSSFIR